MTDKLLTLPQLKEYVPLGRSTIYRMIEDNEFPRPCKVGNRSLWKLSDIQRHIDKLGN